ncbi:hypothetical protein CV102_24375 [Natronococcus pandeyae]|uniref:Uncharacterized protein n=1 Tax=Natronococcus pandeyae TaxID=2055836 RepID=A0A8J8Q0C8_9EURY|nr:hypothetical protein [Natronococcus pandeyae]TYL36078.1 hypothetical protein CV102_24375 [Natronococcus pandeyae]
MSNNNISSQNPPEQLEPAEVAYDQGADGLTVQNETPAEALVIKDCQPWNTTANETVLTEMGVEYDLIPSSAVSDSDLNSYSVVLVPSTQDQSYYDALAEAKADIEAFVDSGGTLVAHVTDNGWPCTTQWDESFLPADVTKENTFANSLEITENHPITEPFSQDTLQSWGSSTHGYLTNLPENATTFVTFDGDGSRPTYAEYSYGNGTVLATMQTLEWPYTGSVSSRPEDPKDLLRTELEYALGETGVTAKATLLHYINGENENVTEGGDPLHSAQMQIFRDEFEFDVKVPGIPRLPDTIPLPVAPVIDSWQKGDMLMEPADDLVTATTPEEDKYTDEFPGEPFNKFRFKNEVEISFESEDGSQINEDSLEIWFNEQGSSGEKIKYKGERESETVLVKDDINNIPVDDWFGTFRDRGARVDRDFSVDTVEIDGTEGVRVSTVTAGYAGFAHDIAGRAARNPIDFIATIFSWYEAIDDSLPGLPDSPDDVFSPPDRPDWLEAPDLSWDSLPDSPERDDVDDILDRVPERPGWDDVPDAPDTPDAPECEDIPGVDDCPSSPFALDAATATTDGGLDAQTLHDTDIDIDLSPEEIIDLIEPYLPEQIHVLSDLISVVPNIYSFYEFTVLADGRRFIRIWDGSRFPSIGAYVDGVRRHTGVVPYEPKQLFSARMIGFFLMASTGITPYTGVDSKEKYLKWVEAQKIADDSEDAVRDGFDEFVDQIEDLVDIFPRLEMDLDDVIADTPWRTSGYDASGEPIEDAAQYLDDDIPNPF